MITNFGVNPDNLSEKEILSSPQGDSSIYASMDI